MSSVDKTVAVLEAIVREEYEPIARKWVHDIVESEIRLAQIRVQERCRSLLSELRFNVLANHLSERGIKLTVEVVGL